MLPWKAHFHPHLVVFDLQQLAIRACQSFIILPIHSAGYYFLSLSSFLISSSLFVISFSFSESRICWMMLCWLELALECWHFHSCCHISVQPPANASSSSEPDIILHAVLLCLKVAQPTPPRWLPLSCEVHLCFDIYRLRHFGRNYSLTVLRILNIGFDYSFITKSGIQNQPYSIFRDGFSLQMYRKLFDGKVTQHIIRHSANP
jgi:hypothetical protein